MAVELRCPECRAKLRLPESPDAGTEVECPKCGTVFAAPEPEDGDDTPKNKPARDDGDDDADEKPKKGAKDESDDKKEKKKTKTKAKGAADASPAAPKKRKSKKNKTSNTALFAVLGAGLLMLVCVGGMLIWYFSRTSKSVEMMYYLPEDTASVQGMNLGHAQKYPEFYKSVSASFKDAEFKAACDTLAKALGVGTGESPGDDLIEYVVFGSGPSGFATVIRTKTEFDQAGLAKLPGAEPKTLGGKTYYLANPFKGGGRKGRVFAPTGRLIVYCPELPDAVFQKMLNGHADSKEKTIGVRAGELGKRVTRGTFWGMTVYAAENKPPAPVGGTAGDDADGKVALARMMGETLGGSKGAGFKASIGSREVRFEAIVWCSDAEKSSSISKKFKESELGKRDDGTPPRWWKSEVETMGSKKIAGQLLSNLGFGSSGELFYAQSSVETVELKDAISSMAGKVTGNDPNAPNNPPPKQRRRVWVRRRACR